MDWYNGSGISDLLVPKDQDLLDRIPSPGIWSNWGIGDPEGFSSPLKYLIMDTSPTEVGFNFNDESFNNEIESFLHDKDQSSISSVCGGLPEQSLQQTALSCGQRNYQLPDLSRFEQMDDIFLYMRSPVQIELLCGVLALQIRVFIYKWGQNRLRQSYLQFSELYKHEPMIAWDSILEVLPSVENLNKSVFFSPEPQCINMPGGFQKEIVSSKFVSCNSKYKDCHDIEAPPVKGLDPFAQIDRDQGMLEQSSLEESILQHLKTVIAQFAKKTRICYRDALYRLAENTKQNVVQDQDGNLKMLRAMPRMDHNETARFDDKKPVESETNTVDRAIANLMFNKMEIMVHDLPLTTAVNCKQEVIGTNGLQGKSSTA